MRNDFMPFNDVDPYIKEKAEKAQEEHYQKQISDLNKELIDMRNNVSRFYTLLIDTRNLMNSRIDNCNAALLRVSICFAASLVILALIIFTK